MKRIRCIAIASLLCVASLAGCKNAPGPSAALPSYGMDITRSAQLPLMQGENAEVSVRADDFALDYVLLEGGDMGEIPARSRLGAQGAAAFRKLIADEVAGAVDLSMQQGADIYEFGKLHFSFQTLPKRVQLYSYYLNADGTQRFWAGEGEEPKVVLDLTAAQISAATWQDGFLSGTYAESNSDAEVYAGYRLLCEWEGRSAQFFFVLRAGSSVLPIQTGSPPAEYSGAVLEKELLTETRVADGYLRVNDTAIEKYDTRGQLLWRRDVNFLGEGRTAAETTLVPTPDGFLLLAAVPETQWGDGRWETLDPVLARYDAQGKELWRQREPKLLGAGKRSVFYLKSGNILLVGDPEKPETRQVGEGSPRHISLSLRDGNGKLLQEKSYGSGGFDTLYAAEYLPGTGTALVADLQSGDVTLGSGTQMFCVDDTLALRWKFSPQGEGYYERSALAADGEAFHLLGIDGSYDKIGADGKAAFHIQLAPQGESRLIGASAHGMAVQTGNEIRFYRGETVTRSLPFEGVSLEHGLRAPGGRAQAIADTDCGFVIAAKVYTGMVNAPPTVSALWYSTELQYTGYDEAGKLLWRVAVDTTPPEWRALGTVPFATE